MILYTVHGANPDARIASVARATGLSDMLGFEPLFCTSVNPDSLAETWFRIFSASPSLTEVIDVFEVDDSQAQAMDVVAWCATCLGGNRGTTPVDETTLKAVLDHPRQEFCDYVVRPDVEVRRHLRFDVRRLLRGDGSGLGLSSESKSTLAYAAQQLRGLATSPDVHLFASQGESIATPTLPEWYRLLTASGVIPLIWALATGRPANSVLVCMDPRDLVSSGGYLRAQGLVAQWDRSVGEPGKFGYEDFLDMRAAFIDGCNQTARVLVEREAQRCGIRRNDTCFCGSGRKYKSCCMRKGMDALARR